MLGFEVVGELEVGFVSTRSGVACVVSILRCFSKRHSKVQQENFN